MKDIFLLVDYNQNFGSKHNALPYRSGMDKTLLSTFFLELNFNAILLTFSETSKYQPDFWDNKYVIYTSSEDDNLQYKSFIEDIVLYLELSGAYVIPAYKHLRANNNKVFMELIRPNDMHNKMYPNCTKVFGCFEELIHEISSIEYPAILKPAAGAMSKGITLSFNKKELVRNAKQTSRTKNPLKELKEYLRNKKHKNYKLQSKFRKKFIAQTFIPNLIKDYKILVYDNKYYILERGTKKGDFRSSGSGIRNFTTNIPDELLGFAYECYQKLNVPNTSLDIGYDGVNFYLIEYQSVFFGSFTITYSDYYWIRNSNQTFSFVEGKSILEKEYVQSIVSYITKHENSLYL